MTYVFIKMQLNKHDGLQCQHVCKNEQIREIAYGR